MKRLLFAFALLAGCQDSLEDDGLDDSFLDDGKADTGGIAENSSSGYAVLRVANESDAGALDDGAGLSSLTAKRMIEHRAGLDGQLGTADDDPFDTLAELDAVPYVGPVAFQKLLARATSLGYIVLDWRTHITPATVSAANPTLCTVKGPAEASELRLMFDIRQGASWRIDIRNTSHTLVQTIAPPFKGWSDAIEGNQLTFAIYANNAYLACKDFSGLLQAVAVHEPVAIDDPFRYATQIHMSVPTPSGTSGGEVGVFSLPNLILLDEYSTGSGTTCARSQTTVEFVPPTDGLYTFRSYADRFLAVRDGGSEGPELACGAQKTSVKLRKGEPVALAVGSNVEESTGVTVLRALTEVSCSDGFDDDGNGDVDCADASCAAACQVKEICDNGVDDNANGKLDCLDDECAASPSCSTNTCPGDDLGTATSATAPVAAGNATLAPIAEHFSCGSTALPWHGSRFYRWRAPTAGTYKFVVSEVGLYDYGIKLLDGTCDGDVLSCGVFSLSNPDVVRTMAANQEIVIEVGLSRYSATSNWTPFKLSIRKQ